jgi:hypothetical protein
MSLTFLHAALALSIGTLSVGAHPHSLSDATKSNERRRVIASVETMFRAAAADDHKMFDEVVERDFYLFDAGSRFDGDSILKVLEQMKASGKTVEWSITQPDVHVQGTTAWITYVNCGSEIESGHITKMQWLESAVLTEDAGEWKLVFMHSTPLPR